MEAADILVVDDSVANLTLLAEILRDAGYKPRLARNGKFALTAVRETPPDLILLDINMPEMNGYEVCGQLKADRALSDIPIIFLSALQETDDKVKAFQAGAADYMTKPFQHEEVLARVRTHLELRRQKLQLQETIQALTRLEALRDNLTHMIVHDMRSPLKTIAGYLTLLADHEGENMSASGLRFIGEARQSIEQLIDTVNSMLDLSRLEAGELKLKLSECDLGDMAASALAAFGMQRGDRQWTLDVPPQKVLINADEALIHRVIQNLIGNAIKFTRLDGRIRVRLLLENRQARLEVIDDGLGIPLESQEKIFEKFGQVESADSRVGTGLGLFFCKLAIELHHGCIGVQSEAGKGSTFWFTLPLSVHTDLAH